MFAKRTLNAATIRYNMVSYVLQSCSSRHFNDVHVIDICQHAGVSKVTFFKYFKSKEDILLYYKSLLTLSLTIQVHQRKLQGIKGLDKIITHFSTEYKERPSLVLGLVNKLTADISPFKPMRIGPAEKYLFYPDIDFGVIDVLSLEQMIDKFVLEAVLNGQIKSSGNVEDLSVVFLSTLYGAIVASHVKGDNLDKLLFQNTLRSLLSHIR
jgi:hypothetical protein